MTTPDPKSTAAQAAGSDVILTGSPLDFELSALLGEAPSDFISLCLDGVPLEGFGTPYDTPRNRADRESLIRSLNDRSAESLWPEMWKNWKPDICKQFGLPSTATAADFRPLVSWRISRVVPGYSSHLHCAIGLLERLRQIVERWGIGSGSAGSACVEITSKAGRRYGETGDSLALVIGLAVKRLLTDESPNTERSGSES